MVVSGEFIKILDSTLIDHDIRILDIARNTTLNLRYCMQKVSGIVYDQEKATPISISEKGEKSKSGFSEFVEKKKQESLYRVQERRRRKYAGDLSNPP